MTNKTVLSMTRVVEISNQAERIYSRTERIRLIEQAVLQSPEIQQLEQRLKTALDVLYEIGHEVQEKSEGDAWRLSNIARDEYERQSAIDAAMEVKP